MVFSMFIVTKCRNLVDTEDVEYTNERNLGLLIRDYDTCVVH